MLVVVQKSVRIKLGYEICVKYFLQSLLNWNPVQEEDMYDHEVFLTIKPSMISPLNF